MHIVVVHQYYLLPGCSGGSRFNEFARMWADAGHEVTVIAGTVDYATGTRPPQYDGRWIVRERDGNVNVLRCYVPGTYASGYRGRMLSFLGFLLSSSSAVATLRTADVVVATSPPLTASVPGWVASRLRLGRIPWVFEVRDLWPESAITTGVLRKDGALARALFRLERLAYQKCDRINVLTPAFRDDILARGLAPADKIMFVPNGADVDMFSPGPRDNAVRREAGFGDRMTVLYAGAHGRANALGQLVDAAERLRSRDDILIACVGDGPMRGSLVEDARGRGLSNIVFHGARPKAEMPDWVRACDVGAAVLQDNPTFRTVYPNKVFDFMATARPVLLGIDGVARTLVCEQAQAGVFAQPEHPDALAAAIVGLADDPAGRQQMGERGLRWVRAEATRTALAQRYLEALTELVHSRK